MNSTNNILIVVFVLYLLFGDNTPRSMAKIINTTIGKVIILLLIIYLFMHSNYVVAFLALLVAYELMRRSSNVTSSAIPTEENKFSQFTAYNQFPYTLEQQIIASRAPLPHSSMYLMPASYKPNSETPSDYEKV